MEHLPNRNDLVDALADASSVHHEYETVTLGGERHAQWAGFYAAFVLGRLGPFLPCSQLVTLLERADGEPWAESAADVVLARGSDG